MSCKKCTALALSVLLSAGLLCPAGAAEVECDGIYCFSGADFSADPALLGVCITGLPESSAGTVLLGSRVVRSGDILTASQLEQLTFQPLRTETDLQASVTYLPIYENRVEAATSMTIAIRGKQDKAPVAEDSAMETYKNLANTMRLNAYDPEGSALTYTVTRQPRRGTVQLENDGSYTYTPKKNKVGTDSFAYTVTDAAGNISREATVIIQILKPATSATYADTIGQDCRFAAEWLRNTGLFVGEQIGSQSCFQPEKTVNKGEFVAMLVQALDIRVDEDAVYTGFSDDVPGWLRPYLAAAMRSGLTAGWQGSEFGADEPICADEAALMIQNALDLTASAVAMEADNTALAVLAENGIALQTDAPLTRAQVAMAIYRTAVLAPTAPGAQVFARQ